MENKTPKEYTQEEQVDISERTKLFETRLQGLSTELKMELVAFPQWIPSQNGFTTIAQIGVRDTKFTPVVSPLGPVENIIKEK